MVIKLRLKQLLKEKKVTQMQLSSMTGLHQSRISSMCNNESRSINTYNLDKIAKALNVDDINELVEYKKPLQ